MRFAGLKDKKFVFVNAGSIAGGTVLHSVHYSFRKTEVSCQRSEVGGGTDL